MSYYPPKQLPGRIIVIERPQPVKRTPAKRRVRTIEARTRPYVETARVPASDSASDSATIDALDALLKAMLFFLGAWLYLFLAHGKPMERKDRH